MMQSYFNYDNTDFYVLPINHCDLLYDNSKINYKEPIQNAKQMADELGVVLYVDGAPAYWNSYNKEKQDAIYKIMQDEGITRRFSDYYRRLRRLRIDSCVLNGVRYSGEELFRMGYDVSNYCALSDLEADYKKEKKYVPSLDRKDIRTVLSFYLIGTHYAYDVLRGIE